MMGPARSTAATPGCALARALRDRQMISLAARAARAEIRDLLEPPKLGIVVQDRDEASPLVQAELAGRDLLHHVFGGRNDPIKSGKVNSSNG